MIRWAFPMFALLAVACVRPTVDCATDTDCFVGEQCQQAVCVPGSVSTNNATTTSCDLDACSTELTADVACRGSDCIVLSCQAGADLCAEGCCALETPPDGVVPLGSMDARLFDVELDPRGYPEVVWADAVTARVMSTRWTGRGWETAIITVQPEPSAAFDLEYDGGVRTLTYLESFGALYHARQDERGVWTSMKVMDPPEPIDLDNLRFFFRLHYAGRGAERVICALFGNVDAGDANVPGGELPDLYVARWVADHWESELFEAELPVTRQCSVAIDELLRPHLAYSVLDDLFYVRYATIPLASSAWVREDDPTRIGAITTNEALQLRGSDVHIFAIVGERNADDELVSALNSYIREESGVWSEQIITTLPDPGFDLGVFDAGASEQRIEVLLLRVDPSFTQLLGGRVVSTQPRTWSALELFEDNGNVGLVKAAVGPDRVHVFSQPTRQTDQLNYFSLEPP